MSWCCHGLEVRNRLRIDSYDDLLLPGHRFLAQIAVGASGEHFKNIFCTSNASTLVLGISYTNRTVRHKITVGKYTVP